ncbi:MAG: N-ethylammeline chlorohydrolase, partial [Megasphaera micronuciformis]|nr:N-ethylammeline chlorohydrolase [Megasphaera micronuciformis]
MAKTLIKNVGLYRNHKITEHGNIEITDDRITAFPEKIEDISAYVTVIDGKDMLALPGFINTHNH